MNWCTIHRRNFFPVQNDILIVLRKKWFIIRLFARTMQICVHRSFQMIEFSFGSVLIRLVFLFNYWLFTAVAHKVQNVGTSSILKVFFVSSTHFSSSIFNWNMKSFNEFLNSLQFSLQLVKMNVFFLFFCSIHYPLQCSWLLFCCEQKESTEF